MVSALGRPASPAEQELFGAALELAVRAYAPYSGYRVGAAAVGPAGERHLGVNVENAAYPVGLCAERAALAALVAAGERELSIVVVAAGDGSDCLPCGMCLQALAEFGDPVIVVQIAGTLRAVSLHDLLTAPFTPRERCS